MIYLLALPLTALVSALHGWGRFRKGYSLPLLAVLFCALLLADGVTHWYAGIIVAAGWRFMFRTGKIARAENGAIQTGDKRWFIHEYWLPFSLTLVTAYISAVMGWFELFIPCICACVMMVVGVAFHQSLHHFIFNWDVFNPAKWYDLDGEKFLDVRRLSEISGGIFVSGIWCTYALLAVAKMIK